MPETAEHVDYGVENGFDNFDFERPLEAANENQPATDELPVETTASEDLGDGRGGEPDAEKPVYANDNAFKFTGTELINIDGSSFTKAIEASGDLEAIALHREMLRQWSEAQSLKLQGSQEFWNPDMPVKEADGETIYKTRMWLNPDGTGGYEIRSIKAPANDNDVEESRAQGLEGANDLVAAIPDYSDEYAVSKETLLINEHEAVAEIEDVSEYETALTSPEIQTGAQPIFESDERVSLEHEEEPVVDDTKYVPVDSPAPREVRAQELNVFLAIDRLPAIDLQDNRADSTGSDEVIILKAPEQGTVDTSPASVQAPLQPVDGVPMSEMVSMEQITRGVRAAERIDEPAPIAPFIEVRTVAAETVRDKSAPEKHGVDIPAHNDSPIVERLVSVPQKIHVRNADLPVHVFAHETRANKINNTDQKEIRSAVVKTEKPKAEEEFRRRRGRTRYGEETSYKPRYDYDDHIPNEVPRSLAETSVVKMVERFTPEMQDVHRANTAPETADSPIAKVETIEHKAPEIRELDTHEKSLEVDTPAAQKHVSLEVPHVAETTRRDIEGSDVIPFREFSRIERNTQAEIDEVLVAHGLTRQSSVETESLASVEIASGSPRQAHLAGTSDDQASSVIAFKGGIRMIKRAA